MGSSVNVFRQVETDAEALAYVVEDLIPADFEVKGLMSFQAKNIDTIPTHNFHHVTLPVKENVA